MTNFTRLQIFSLEFFFAPGGPGAYRGPGPEASASPVSWMVRPRCTVRSGARTTSTSTKTSKNGSLAGHETFEERSSRCQRNRTSFVSLVGLVKRK